MQFLRANTDPLAKITLPGPFTMGSRSRTSTTRMPEAMCMDYAAAVNEEAHALVKGRRRRDPARRALAAQQSRRSQALCGEAINRALEGITVPTVIHHLLRLCRRCDRLKPTGYSFLPQLSDTIAQQISIESAQPKLDLGVLKDLAPKKVMLGVIDLSDPAVETLRRSPAVSAPA